MSWCRFFRIDINSLELYGVFLGIAIRCWSRKVFNLGIRLQYRKCIARQYLLTSANPSTIFILLHFPVAKYLTGVGCLRCSSCRRFRCIYISVSICRSSITTVAAICIVFNYDTGSTFQSRMPLSVDIKFRSDPETINIRVRFRINKESIIIIGICHIDSLIIRSFYSVLIDCIGFAVEHLSKFRLKIPAIKCISCQVSTSRLTDMSAFTDTEGHLLFISTPVDITGSSFRIINMKEYTVLLLTPFCIHSDTSLWDGSECAWMSAGIIKIPAFKHISGWSMLRIRFI